MRLGRGASHKKKKNSMPNFCMAPATRRGAGGPRIGGGGGGLYAHHRYPPMRSDGIRYGAIATAQPPVTSTHNHPHQRPSAGGRGRGRGRGRKRAYRHLPPPTIGHCLSMHIRGYRNAHHRPPTSTHIAPHFFRNARHITRRRADGGGMTGGGCGRGLATARFGWCN